MNTGVAQVDQIMSSTTDLYQTDEARPDVLTFTSLTLQEPMELAGEVVRHLAFSTDALDTDFVVKLCDVYPDGRSIAVAEGVLQARYRGRKKHRNIFFIAQHLIDPHFATSFCFSYPFTRMGKSKMA